MSKGNSAAGLGCLLYFVTICIGLILLTLKLAQAGLVADWSWWAVLAPWYGVPLVLLVMYLICLALERIFGKLADMLNMVTRSLRARRERNEKKRNPGSSYHD